MINNERERISENIKSNESAHFKGTVKENLCKVREIRIGNDNCPVLLRGGGRGLTGNEETVPLAAYKGMLISGYDDPCIDVLERHTNNVENHLQELYQSSAVSAEVVIWSWQFARSHPLWKDGLRVDF